MLPGKAAYEIPADRSSLDETAAVCRHFLCLKDWKLGRCDNQSQ